MWFPVALVAIVVATAGCRDDRTAAAPTSSGAKLADLTVTVDNDGNGGAKARTTSVSCDAASDSATCRAVAGIKPRTFEPTPGDVACTELYGGPETAAVEGRLRGVPVHARFSRQNGCEIARWNAAAKLLEAAG